MSSFRELSKSWLNKVSSKRINKTEDTRYAPLFVVARLCADFQSTEQSFFNFSDITQFLFEQYKEYCSCLNPETDKIELTIYKPLFEDNTEFLTEQELQSIFLWRKKDTKLLFSFALHPDIHEAVVSNENIHYNIFEEARFIREKAEENEKILMNLASCANENADVCKALRVAKTSFVAWKVSQLLSDYQKAMADFIFVASIQSSSNLAPPEHLGIYYTVKRIYKF